MFDVDCDGITDLHDFGHYVQCVQPPFAATGGVTCEEFDSDMDDDIDLLDFGAFQITFTYPGILD